jgi:hypothetical protein
MNLSRTCLIAILLGSLTPAFAVAADFNMDVKTSGVKLGTHIMGPELSNSDLKGQVVMLEYWGLN